MDPTQHAAVHQLEHAASALLQELAGEGGPGDVDRVAELAAKLVPILDALAYLDSGDHGHE